MFSLHGGLGKLRDLNKECNLEESSEQKKQFEEIYRVIHDPEVTNHEKYQAIYKALQAEQFNKEGESLLKYIYQLLEATIINPILKADLSYLMSISKSKDFIPTLDATISQLKKDS